MEENISTHTDVQTAPVCFVVMPYSSPEGYAPDHFTKIYEHIFKPAIEDAGFTALRCDEIHNGKPIHTNMFSNLLEAPMVLCDLTGDNPNVMYELGRRDAHGKPVVRVREDGQSSPFNVREHEIIPYRKGRVIDEVPEDRAKITQAIKETFSSNIDDSPNVSSPPRSALESMTEHYLHWSFKKQRFDSPKIQITPLATSMADDYRRQLVAFLLSAYEIRQQLNLSNGYSAVNYAQAKLDELRILLDCYKKYCSVYDENCHDAEDLILFLETYIRRSIFTEKIRAKKHYT